MGRFLTSEHPGERSLSGVASPESPKNGWTSLQFLRHLDHHRPEPRGPYARGPARIQLYAIWIYMTRVSPGAQELAVLSREIVECARCPRLRTHCRETARARKRQFKTHRYWGLPVPGFGDPDARLLVVGLAPAAHGANRTGRMFTGDSSGDWLYEALYRFGFASQPESVGRDDGLTLRDCFITAAARCAPPGNRPTARELAACRGYLERELTLLNRVRVVVTLGGIAHQAWLRASGWWDRLSPAGRPEFGHLVESVLENLTLISSYHPSRQNTNTGRLTREMWHAVFERCRTILAG